MDFCCFNKKKKLLDETILQNNMKTKTMSSVHIEKIGNEKNKNINETLKIVNHI